MPIYKKNMLLRIMQKLSCLILMMIFSLIFLMRNLQNKIKFKINLNNNLIKVIRKKLIIMKIILFIKENKIISKNSQIKCNTKAINQMMTYNFKFDFLLFF